MSLLLPLVLTILFAPADAIPGVQAPPGGTLESELTNIAYERAQAETKRMLSEMERDQTIPAATKKEVKTKLARLKIAVYLTPEKLEDVVAAYNKSIPGSSFIFAERAVVPDVYDVATERGIMAPSDTERTWSGKSIRYARFTTDDQSLQIAVEDHLVDPRTAKVSKTTVVMVQSLGR